MRKLLALFFVLVSVNCYGITPELKESLKKIRTDHTRDFVPRFITIMEKLEETQDQLQKEILKVNLSIEANLIDKGFIKDIEEYQQEIKNYENQIENETSANQIKNLIKFIKYCEQEIDQTYDYLQLVHQVAEELMGY
jgi:flagellar biosynthesis chaperone FliJ